MQTPRDKIHTAETDMNPPTGALLRFALTLVDDPAEAHALVAQAVEAARESAPRSAPDEAVVFRFLRRAYHSVERSRPRRRMRDASVNALAASQEPTRGGAR